MSIDLGSLLSTLYSGTSGSGGGVSADPVGDLARAEKTETKAVAAVAQQPAVARDIAAFTAKVASATSAASLLKDPTVLKVLLTANGLGDQTGYPALAQKALLSDTTKTGSLASTLSNTAWKTTAATYLFATKGLAILQKPSVIAAITNGYAEVAWRKSLDATTPGLSNALAFKAQASTITSVDQILGDSTLRAVVTTALGIPNTIAVQELEAQERAISSRVDITKFKDPKFVAAFTNRYLVAANTAGASTSQGSASLEQLASSARGLVV